MKHLIFSKPALGIFAAVLLIFGNGCEVFNEALQAELEYGSSDRGSSDEFRPRFMIAICSIVKYPRAQWLEQAVECNGKTIWINKNQHLDSKRIRRIKAIPRPGNPDVCDIELQLDPVGKTHWQMLVAAARGQEVAMMIDNRCVGTFTPEMPDSESDRIDWVRVRIGVDPYTAKGLVRFAPKNHDHFNPDASNWFKF